MLNSTAPTKHAAYLRARSALEAYLECELERLLRDGEQIEHIALGHSQMREICASHAYIPRTDPRYYPASIRGKNQAVVGIWLNFEIRLENATSLIHIATKYEPHMGNTIRL